MIAGLKSRRLSAGESAWSASAAVVFESIPIPRTTVSMSVSASPARRVPAAPAGRYRFGREDAGPGGEPSVEWLLKRNCSLAPHTMLICLVALSVPPLCIAAILFLHGAVLVAPFAALEVLAVVFAVLVYARHASDFESIRHRAGRLTVEHASGARIERVEFRPDWVRIEPRHGDGSLIELSGQGHRIAVGRFVRPELRRQLADELRWALRHRPFERAGGVA